MSVGLSSRLRGRALRVARLLTAVSPARWYAERSVAAAVGFEKLTETGASVARFFGGSAASVSTRPVTPDVTVVIPVYNSETWLDDCLSGVLAQTDVDLEVVCVDDGSTDASLRVLQRYADSDVRVRVVSQSNAGQSVARNTGLAEARGRYLIYLDSDDFWREDKLAALVDRADQHTLDVLLFDTVAFRDGEVTESTWHWYSSYYRRIRSYGRPRSGARMIADMRRWGDYRPHVGMYLTRTDSVRDAQIKFVPGIVHQDNPYTFALLLSADRVAHVRQFFYARRLRAGSTITGLRTATSAKGYFMSYLAMSRALRRYSFDAKTTAILRDVVGDVLVSACRKVAALPVGARAEMDELDPADDARAALRWCAASRDVGC